ncbi:MAG: GNAT family protein [Caulobacteraceae bacterium]|nr:GNAT family protein [Caulobacteraceae bacterium]
MTVLVAAEDADFAWMLGEGPGRPGLVLPPGGVDDPVNLAQVRAMCGKLRGAHDRGAWMIVCDGEVVGLCGYLRPPNAEGEVEIGYGVAASRRNRGHATRAVTALLDAVAEDPAAQVVTATTASANIASQRTLERNGFERIGIGFDPEDGEVVRWSLLA